jgi:hypothetical protein
MYAVEAYRGGLAMVGASGHSGSTRPGDAGSAVRPRACAEAMSDRFAPGRDMHLAGSPLQYHVHSCIMTLMACSLVGSPARVRNARLAGSISGCGVRWHQAQTAAISPSPDPHRGRSACLAGPSGSHQIRAARIRRALASCRSQPRGRRDTPDSRAGAPPGRALRRLRRGADGVRVEPCGESAAYRQVLAFVVSASTPRMNGGASMGRNAS